jgi:hypothetical protein
MNKRANPLAGMKVQRCRCKLFLLHAIYGMQLSYSSKFRVAVSGGGERSSHVADS